MALTSASWVVSLQHLDIRFITKGRKNYIFTFGKLHKAWRKGKLPPSVKVNTFEEDTKLFVFATLEEYLKRTKAWRGKDKSQLLSRERQVLTLNLLRDTLDVQLQDQKLG